MKSGKSLARVIAYVSNRSQEIPFGRSSLGAGRALPWSNDGLEGRSRTRHSLRTTDFKSASGLLTSFYYAIPSSIYRRFSRQSRLRPAWYRHMTPSFSPHLCRSMGTKQGIRACVIIRRTGPVKTWACSRELSGSPSVSAFSLARLELLCNALVLQVLGMGQVEHYLIAVGVYFVANAGIMVVVVSVICGSCEARLGTHHPGTHLFIGYEAREPRV